MEMKFSGKERIKLLVVDDIAQNLLAMSATLGSDEVEVISASSGTEALELLLQHEFALAILDVQMPGMDGYALAELMRGTERTQGIPIIFLTAGAHDEQRSFKGYEAGAVDFLYKPIDPRVLRSKVAIFAELYRQRIALARRMAEQERLTRLNSMMLAALSCDIRTPLAALTLNAELLVRRGETPLVCQSGERIKAVTAMLGRQVDHLVNLARQPCDELHPNTAWGDLGVLIAECLHGGGVSLSPQISFSQVGDAHCEFDAVLLSDAVDYLLLQALTYSDGQPVQVLLDGEARHAVTLRLSCTTVPSGEIAHHLFGTGLAADGAASPRVGTGLHMTERVARAHGGSLIGRAKAGEGMLVELILPRGDGRN